MLCSALVPGWVQSCQWSACPDRSNVLVRQWRQSRLCSSHRSPRSSARTGIWIDLSFVRVVSINIRANHLPRVRDVVKVSPKITMFRNRWIVWMFSCNGWVFDWYSSFMQSFIFDLNKSYLFDKPAKNRNKPWDARSYFIPTSSSRRQSQMRLCNEVLLV